MLLRHELVFLPFGDCGAIVLGRKSGGLGDGELTKCIGLTFGSLRRAPCLGCRIDGGP